MRTSSTSAGSYLVNKTHLKQRALTLRIPQHVYDALNAMRERADKSGFVFDIQAVVVEALERAVDRVSGDLNAVEQGSPVGVKEVASRRKRRTALGVEGLTPAE
ncbi:MAG: hypothetical protein WCK83_13255 [Burkholderiales bacterium]